MGLHDHVKSSFLRVLSSVLLNPRCKTGESEVGIFEFGSGPGVKGVNILFPFNEEKNSFPTT